MLVEITNDFQHFIIIINKLRRFEVKVASLYVIKIGKVLTDNCFSTDTIILKFNHFSTNNSVLLIEMIWN